VVSDDELERIRKEAAMVYSRYSQNTCLEGLRKITKNLNQDSQCPGRDSNRAPAQLKSSALPLEQPVLC
jgi:hypothetical protein